MGREIRRDRFEEAEFPRFSDRLRLGLRALSELLARPEFGHGPTTLGAEVELAIIDEAARPLPLNRAVLAESLDPQLSLELDRFNLEYNLTPVPLAGEPFVAIEDEMRRAIGDLNACAAPFHGRVVPIGILPTLRTEDLQSQAMTDLPRYRALAAGLRRLRAGPFEVRIDGLDPLFLEWDDVTLEGANTSLQIHLRVAPAEFASTYNAAQLATAPILALSGNSPTFLGHRLWHETRVVLFKQTVDHRHHDTPDWSVPPRVDFGNGWIREGAYELFAEGVALYPPLLPICETEDSLARVRAGELPQLDELRLHNGTIWRWNRAIYDPGAGGHLRIELRALPAGPTSFDMLANAAVLLGLTASLRDRVSELLPAFPFQYAERNFYRAAQHGLDARLLWPDPDGPTPREVPAKELALELLPRAHEGLLSLGVSDREALRAVENIRARLERGITPASWQLEMLKRLEARGLDRSDALAQMLESYFDQARKGDSVADWTYEA